MEAKEMINPTILNHDEALKLVYDNLRSEINKHIELQQQLASITVTFSTAIFAAALAYHSRPSIALLYPPAALFLAMGWNQRNYVIRDIANFILNNLEKSFPEDAKWETYLSNKKGIAGLNAIIFSNGSLFLVSQIMALFIGIYIIIIESKTAIDINPLYIVYLGSSSSEKLLIVFDIFCSIVVLYYIIHTWRKESPKPTVNPRWWKFWE